MIPKRSGSPVLFKSILIGILVTFGIITFNLSIANRRYVDESSATDDIVKENQKLGTRTWWSEQSDQEPLIEGFSTQFSYEANDPAIFKIAVSSELLQTFPTVKVQLWIYRLGYYGGLGATLASNITYTAKSTNQQPNCLFDTASRMTDCDNWHASVVWKIPQTASNGIYVAVPVTYQKNKRGIVSEIRGSYIPFVIRQRNPNTDKKKKKTNSSSIRFGSDILFKTSDMTWVVYNKYGGWNLYRGNGSYTFDSRATKASYNRPFQNRQYKPQGQFENFLFGAEYPLLFFLEKHGYDVSYASCEDVENMGNNGQLIPSNYRILLSVGHDEYYTQALRDSYKNARNSGVNLAFFSSNEMFWRTKWEDQNIIYDYNDRLEYVRTAGKGNLSRSFFTTENHGTGRTYELDYTKYNLKSRKLTGEGSNRIIENGNKSNENIRKRSIKITNIKDDNNSKSSSRHMQQNKDGDRDRNKDKDKEYRFIPKEKSIRIRLKRIINCAKETLDSKPLINTNTNVQKDWTGTFTDPRFRIPEPELSLTGQRFAVNGFRSDAIEINENESNLRFWRNTDLQEGVLKFPYRTENGYLGYEWDIFSDNCHKPKGLFFLSSTTEKINKGLSENFGESYKGTDSVTHKLSLYRHICSENKDHDINNDKENKNEKQKGEGKKLLKIKNKINFLENEKNLISNNPNEKNSKNLTNFLTSLVFGSGTLQWSWALSDFHDGPHVRENKYLQQATINLFAEMNVQPKKLIKNDNEKLILKKKSQLKSKSKKKEKKKSKIIEIKLPQNMDDIFLKLGVKSTDYEAPYSIIEYPGNNSVFYLNDKYASTGDTVFKRPISSRKLTSPDKDKDIQDYDSNQNNFEVKKMIKNSNDDNNSVNNNDDDDSDNNDNNNNRYDSSHRHENKDRNMNSIRRKTIVNSDNNNNNTDSNKIFKKKRKHRNKKEDEYITIKGFARDRGGGKVAGVEISTDNGITWRQADGTSTWEFIFKVSVE